MNLQLHNQPIDSLLDQLWEFRDYDAMSTNMTRDEYDLYHTILLKRKRLIYCMDGNRLVGYVESWRINSDQLSRVIAGEYFDIGMEDIQRCPICYVANVTIHPDYRKSGVCRMLRDYLFETNFFATHFIGHRIGRMTERLKVFKADHHLKEIMNGKV